MIIPLAEHPHCSGTYIKYTCAGITFSSSVCMARQTGDEEHHAIVMEALVVIAVILIDEVGPYRQDRLFL